MIQKSCHATKEDFVISKFAPPKTIVLMTNFVSGEDAKLWDAIRKEFHALKIETVWKGCVQGLNVVMNLDVPLDLDVKRDIARKVKFIKNI